MQVHINEEMVLVILSYTPIQLIQKPHLLVAGEALVGDVLYILCGYVPLRP